MNNDLKYWDSGFPIGSTDNFSVNDMLYWDMGFVFMYIATADTPPPPPTLAGVENSKFFFFF